MPKISVIVPVYNTEKYLDKCLDSIVNQTFQDIEVIVVNDGSTDKSEKIILEYKNKYPEKIKYFKKENEGLSTTRNYGVKKAIGNYLSFVDSDDCIDINLFSNLQEEINKQVDLIKFKLVTVDNKYNEIARTDGPVFNNIDGQDAFNKLVFKDNLLEPACIYLYKKDYFIKNNYIFEKNRYNEDFGLIPIAIANSKKVSSINIYGYYYLQSDNSITRNGDYKKTYKSAHDLLFHYDNLIKKISESQLDKLTVNNLKQYYTNSILNKAKDLKKEDQNQYILEIKKRRMIKNIRPKNIKQLFKKIILKINIKVYLKCI